MRSDFKSFLLGVLVLSVLVGVVFAAHTIIFSDARTTLTANEDSYFLYNFTIDNTDAGVSNNITSVNITFPSGFTINSTTNGTTANGTFIIDGQVLSWDNGTTLILNQSNASFWINVSAATPGNYNISISTYNASNNASRVSTTNLSITINDTTAPATIAYGASTPSANQNMSQSSIYINITVTDNGVVETINLTLINSTGDIINGTNSSSGVTSIVYNVTGLADGNYSFNASVNDTFGNQNVSILRAVILYTDTTSPTVTQTCTPAEVSEGESVTCSCTATDSGSKVNSSTWINESSTPSTASQGTLTQTCTVRDNAGNLGSKSTTYVVTGSSGGSPGGSSSGSTYTKTYVQDSKEFSEIKTLDYELKKGERVRIKVDGKKHTVGISSLTTTTADIEVFSTLQKATLSVGDERKFEVSDDDYYDIYIKLNSIESSKADVTINSIYEKITPESETVEEEKQEAAEEQAAEERGEISESDLSWLWWLIGIIVVLVIIALGYKYIVNKE